MLSVKERRTALNRRENASGSRAWERLKQEAVETKRQSPGGRAGKGTMGGCERGPGNANSMMSKIEKNHRGALAGGLSLLRKGEDVGLAFRKWS